MTDGKVTASRAVFDTLCASIEGLGCRYQKDEAHLCARFSVRGDDLPIMFELRVDEERELVILMSPIPIRIPEEKRLDVAVAVSMANHSLSDGCFDYDITEGKLYFRISDSFIGKPTGRDVLEYMMRFALAAVDAYNDRFFLLCCGKLALEQFELGADS